MSKNDKLKPLVKDARTTSFSGSEPSLNKDTPVNLRKLRQLRTSFDHARCPYISRQIKDAEKTESQRREESSKGSLMVKLHKPFPELRPKHEKSQIRKSFDKAWFQEQRRAQQEQGQQKKQEKTKPQPCHEPGYEP